MKRAGRRTRTTEVYERGGAASFRHPRPPVVRCCPENHIKKSPFDATSNRIRIFCRKSFRYDASSLQKSTNDINTKSIRSQSWTLKIKSTTSRYEVDIESASCRRTISDWKRTNCNPFSGRVVKNHIHISIFYVLRDRPQMRKHAQAQ